MLTEAGRERWGFKLSVVAIAFSLGSLCFTYLQLRTSLWAFRTDERAWVELEPIKPINFRPEDDKFPAMFKYEIYPKNVGKTSARDIELRILPPLFASMDSEHSVEWINFQDKILNKEVPSAADIPVEGPFPKVLGPSTASSVPFVVHAQAPMVNGKMVQFIVGRINYVDAFEVKHWLKFCFFVVDTQGNLRTCTVGNDEDRNVK
jgi:hypothetical protein